MQSGADRSHQLVFSGARAVLTGRVEILPSGMFLPIGDGRELPFALSLDAGSCRSARRPLHFHRFSAEMGELDIEH